MPQLWRFPALPLVYQAGTAVTVAETLTSGLAGLANQLPALPPVQAPGSKLTLEADLEITSTSATPTVTLGFYIGSIGQAIGSKTAIAVSTTIPISASAAAWAMHMRYVGTWRELSSTAGTLHGAGWIDVATSLTAQSAGPYPFPITQALRTVSTLNTTQYNELDLGITLSSTTGSPSVTVTDFWAELTG
jgi:hypothetical protein